MTRQPRRARIALVAGFGALFVAARLFEFHSDRPGIAGTVATVAIVAMLIGGVISLYIGFSSLDWKKIRTRWRKRRQR